MNDAEIEKEKYSNKRYHDGEEKYFHTDVSLCTFYPRLYGRGFPFQLFRCQAYGTAYHSPRTDNTYNTSHRNTADTYISGIGCKYLFGTHLGNRQSCIAAIELQYRIPPKKVESRYNQKPNKNRTCTNDKAVFQSYNITEPQNRCSGIDFKNQLCLLGHRIAKRQYTSRQYLAPPAERR
ncbi:unknown [Bacteroides sp. CAG:144]|nr:unknown [Bacteroides sp. CAG:144]